MHQPLCTRYPQILCFPKCPFWHKIWYVNIVLLKHINDIITDHNSLENPEAHTWIVSYNLFGVLAFLQCIFDSLLGGVCLSFTPSNSCLLLFTHLSPIPSFSLTVGSQIIQRHDLSWKLSRFVILVFINEPIMANKILLLWKSEAFRPASLIANLQ